MTNMSDELAKLHTENTRLIALLEAHGICWKEPIRIPVTEESALRLTPDEKVALFRRLFRGRLDVYPTRWESTTGKSGYSPACAHEWQAGICEKPRIKCSDCNQRALLPVTHQVIYDHLAGIQTMGVYPLLTDDSCYFLAIDFDEGDWREDALAFMQSCHELDVQAALEISRSGNGAHLWIFFTAPVPARDARRLGAALISHTCARTRQLRLTSYDRMFPNQDCMPKGGFGNLIALPLQKKARERGGSVFVDETFQPFIDQWAYLASLQAMSIHAVEAAILRATDGNHPLDVAFISDENQPEPWKRSAASSKKLSAPIPTSVTVTLANLIYFEKSQLSQPLANRLIRLAAFQNPEFYKAQAMRFPVWDKPRVIGCAENYPSHIALPRGCLDAVQILLRENNIHGDLRDERFIGSPLQVDFTGVLRLDQEVAVAAILHHEIGVLCAPTAFGKTVTAAALIARRGINTLVLVHRTELLKQWQERLQSFLGVGKGMIGTIGGGKSKPTGNIDIAVMQSLSRTEEAGALVENYGQLIIDECHHLSAFSFEKILKQAKAKYVLGLTATPIRRDGQQPIIFMQCGPIRHMASTPENAPRDLQVLPHRLPATIHLAKDTAIQDIFRHITNDADRTFAIATAIKESYRQGRNVLVLTERTDHLDAIKNALGEQIETLFLLHGRLSKKQRSTLIDQLNSLPDNSARVLLATGKLVGEGFDHPPLDTLILAMPISWRGTLQQYAGRLHRDHVNKADVRIIDFIDTGHPVLLRMWDKRQRGYRAMGYQIIE